MKNIITLLAAIFLIIHSSNSQTQLGQDFYGEANNDILGSSVCMPDPYTVAIGANLNDGNATDAGHVRIYSWNGSSWVQKGSDLDGEAAYDRSGTSNSVSMPDSNTVAIGAYYNDGNGTEAGHVRIYRWNGSSWIQKGSDLDGEAANDWSGYCVSMPDSNTVAIGAPKNGGFGPSSGHVRIYRWDGNAWIQKGGDLDGKNSYTKSGWSVSMPDSNTVAIGTDLTTSSHVCIYRWTGSTWVQKGNDVEGKVEKPGDYSALSVSMSDSNTVAIGAHSYDGNASDAGQVRIFSWNGSAWMQKGSDLDGEASDDWSGNSLSMPDSNTVAIGASRNDGNATNAGHVRIYRWSGSAWVQLESDLDGQAAHENFGRTVSMPDGNTVAIGAPGAGLVRIYKLKEVTSGIEENNFGTLFSVYPNPTTGQLNIDLGSYYSDVIVIIRNTLGQEVSQKKLSGSDQLKLTIPGEAGLYFIDICSGDRKAMLKVVKE